MNQKRKYVFSHFNTIYKGVDQMMTVSPDAITGSAAIVAALALAVLAPHKTSAIATTTVSNQQEKNFEIDEITYIHTSPCSHLVIIIFFFLGETQEKLRTLIFICKKFNEDCKQPGIKWGIIPMIIVIPLENDGGEMVNLFFNLHDSNQLL